MSHWNYRVIRKHNEKSNTNAYQIHEVYYRDDLAIDAWTESAVEPSGETPGELREDIRFFMKAFQKPILEEKIKDRKPVLVADDDSQELNDGHYFELMDRASVAVDYIYQFLGCHPLMKRQDKLFEIYERAEEALADLYQEASHLEFERTEKREWGDPQGLSEEQKKELDRRYQKFQANHEEGLSWEEVKTSILDKPQKK